MTIRGVRSKVAGAVAGAGALSLLLGVAALVAAPAASADQEVAASGHGNPPGNNGTVKIEGVDLQSKPPDNNPHQGCTFVVEFYNLDQGDYKAKVTFNDQAPTADAGLQVVSGNLNPFIGGDNAGGGNDLDARETYTLKFTGEPHPQQGYHVKLTVNAPGSVGNDKKHKVFWVEGCKPTTPPTTPPTTSPTTPPTDTPPTTPPTDNPPTTPPTDSPTPSTSPSTTDTPPTTPPADSPTPSTSDTPTASPPSDTPSSPATSATPSAPGPSDSDTPTVGVPTEVDAGLGGSLAAVAGGNGPVGILGGVLIAAGGVMLAAGGAVALRRRGKHSIAAQ